jgi:hypothetical protein
MVTFSEDDMPSFHRETLAFFDSFQRGAVCNIALLPGQKLNPNPGGWGRK